MKPSEETWRAMQSHLGYNEEEMLHFRKRPENGEVLAKAPELMGQSIVFEVVESAGCNSRHRVGDRIVFDGAGNLISKAGPKKVCIYSLTAVAPLIFAANELIYAGANPNAMKFRRAGCFDVGVKCGGWGRVVWECHVEHRQH